MRKKQSLLIRRATAYKRVAWKALRAGDARGFDRYMEIAERLLKQEKAEREFLARRIKR